MYKPRRGGKGRKVKKIKQGVRASKPIDKEVFYVLVVVVRDGEICTLLCSSTVVG